MPDLNWPQEGDKAFRDPKRKGPLHLTDAIVAPGEDAYLNGFKRAVDMVVDASGAGGIDPSELFYPVAYLYRHHLELMLKELVRLGVQLGSLKACEEILVDHNLHRLWNRSKQLILRMWPDSFKEEAFRATEHLVLEFHKIDPHGQAFRYACDTEGKEHLKDGPKIVDLRNLKKVVDAVSNFLDASYTGIESSDPGPL